MLMEAILGVLFLEIFYMYLATQNREFMDGILNIVLAETFPFNLISRSTKQHPSNLIPICMTISTYKKILVFILKHVFDWS